MPRETYFLNADQIIAAKEINDDPNSKIKKINIEKVSRRALDAINKRLKETRDAKSKAAIEAIKAASQQREVHLNTVAPIRTNTIRS